MTEKESLSETTEKPDDLGSWITIEFDPKTEKATWRLKNLTHQQAMWILIDVLRNCMGFALGEGHHHHAHEEDADDH